MSGGRANFDLKEIPGTTVFESEKDFTTTIVDGRFRLFSNPWNRGATTGHHRQKIFVNDDKGKTIFGWVWKWRDSSGVATYPEVQVGVSPWNGEAAPNSGFPFLAGTKKLVANYDIAMEASGSYNLAFEFWAVSALPPSKDTITHEVMIWIAGQRLGAAGSEVGKTTIDGNEFSIIMKRDQGDASGGSSNIWTIITLLAAKPILHGPLDVGAIIDTLIKSGYLNKNLYIANLELGNEVMQGTGTTIVRNYSITVE